MASINDYLNLVTSQHSDKPKFMAMLSLYADCLVTIQNVIASMPGLFDVDVAIGNQLDIVGEWVGVSRQVNIPLPSVYFAWGPPGSDPSVGWGMGIWQGNNPGTITNLPDDVYRTILRAKIAANSWDGTTNGFYAIWDTVFPTLRVLIQDNLDMSYNVTIVGGEVDSLTLALLTGGYIPLKPAGIRVKTYYIATPGSTAVFGWGIENDYIKGWGEGAWARPVT